MELYGIMVFELKFGVCYSFQALDMLKKLIFIHRRHINFCRLGGGGADPAVCFRTRHTPQNPGWYEFRVKRPKIGQNESNLGPKTLKFRLFWLFLGSWSRTASRIVDFSVCFWKKNSQNLDQTKFSKKKMGFFGFCWLKNHQIPTK